MASLSPKEASETLLIENLSSDEPSWSALLSWARDARKKNLGEESCQASLEVVKERVFCHFSAIGEQLEAYLRSVSEKEMANEAHSVVVKDTRAALRFGVACLSIGQSSQSNETFGRAAQNEMVFVAGLHVKVSLVLSKPGGDSRCRILSAQLLCNMVTRNSDTALAIAKEIQLSPSEEIVSTKIMNSMSHSVERTTETSTSWVEMMLHAAQEGNRSALEAVAAALHNCVASLENLWFSDDDNNDTRDVVCKSASEFASNIATNHLLVSTLLRNMLSVDVIKRGVQNETESLGDGTTEWIVLILRRLCSFGLLPEMYLSASGVMKPDDTVACSVTPEQVVLLHCVERVVDDSLHSSSNKSSHHPLGRDGAILSSLLYLASQASFISRSLSRDCQNLDPFAEKNDMVYEESAYSPILEILSSSLGVEGVEEVDECRTRLGIDTQIIQDTSRDLGRIVDDLSVKNRGKNARELSMSDREQRLITVLVRLLGNLCFQNRQNQDLMRSTIVPFSSELALEPEPIDKPERTALHVLLSCTSFSYCCFTLREWSIVAVRNALDSNEKNQQLVEQLEVQQALNTPELQRMGVKVELDRQGKVVVEDKKKPFK